MKSPDFALLKEKAKLIRRAVVEMVYRAKSQHIGCSLSAADIVTALYFYVMNIDPKNPHWDNRDRFVLSKGHAVAGLYAALAHRGFFPEAELQNYVANGSPLAGHVVLNCVPGADSSNGSGGHGLSLGIGMALAAENMQTGSKTFVLMGDGEMEEGSVWEAIAFAGVHKVQNLKLVVDCNKFQILGSTKDVFDLEPFEEKFRSFRWEAERIDGNKMEEIVEALTRKTEGPHVILANTTKGKGVSFMEGKVEWHGKYPTPEQYEIALKELA